MIDNFVVDWLDNFLMVVVVIFFWLNLIMFENGFIEVENVVGIVDKFDNDY